MSNSQNQKITPPNSPECKFLSQTTIILVVVETSSLMRDDKKLKKVEKIDHQHAHGQ